MKHIAKIMLVFALFAFVFMAKPAKAFYLEVPQVLKNLLLSLKSAQTFAQEQTTIVQPVYTPPAGGTTQPYPTPPSGDQHQQYQGTQQYPTQGTQPYPTSPTGDQYNQYPQGTQQYPSGDQQYQGQQYQGMQGGSQQGQMQGQQGMSSGDQGRGMQGDQDSSRQLAEMKRNMKQMGRMVKQFEQMIASAEKKGTTVPEETKQNLAKLKSILDSVNNAKSFEDLQDVDMSAMGDLTQSLEDFRREVVEKQQRIDGMKRGMRGMEQGLKMFKSQVARLAKSKVTVPADVAENIAKLEAIIAQVKNAKTTEEIEAIDFESMQDLMQNMDESRQKLEHLSRWPQTLKDINRQLTQMQREVKRAKSIADRLVKKGLDVQDLYTAFADAVGKLQSVRDAAVEKMSAGNGEEAFDLIESEFFGQMEDVWQHLRVLMMMSNMGQFTSEFKREMAQAQQMINRLKRQKKDVSELESILQLAKAKGQEIQDMIKTKDFDEETIKSAFDEMENIGQEFDSKVAELTGQEEVMPWEKGPQQFRRVEMNKDVQQFIPQRPPSQPQAELEVSQPTETATVGF